MAVCSNDEPGLDWVMGTIGSCCPGSFSFSQLVIVVGLAKERKFTFSDTAWKPIANTFLKKQR